MHIGSFVRTLLFIHFGHQNTYKGALNLITLTLNRGMAMTHSSTYKHNIMAAKTT